MSSVTSAVPCLSAMMRFPIRCIWANRSRACHEQGSLPSGFWRRIASVDCCFCRKPLQCQNNGGGRSLMLTRLRIASDVGTRREMPSSSQRSGSSAFPKPQSESMRRSTSATLRLLFDPALPQRRHTNY